MRTPLAAEHAEALATLRDELQRVSEQVTAAGEDDAAELLRLRAELVDLSRASAALDPSTMSSSPPALACGAHTC